MHTPSSDNYTLHIIKNKEELRFKTKIPRLNVLKLALIISCVYSVIFTQYVLELQLTLVLFCFLG